MSDSERLNTSGADTCTDVSVSPSLARASTPGRGIPDRTRAFRKLGRVLRDMPRTSPRIRRMHHAYRVRQLARRRRHR